MYAWTTIWTPSLDRSLTVCNLPDDQPGRNTAARAARCRTPIWWDEAMTPAAPFAPDATLADVGEFGLIRQLTEPLRAGPAGVRRAR